MIYTTMSNLSDYYGLSENLNIAIDYLKYNSLQNLSVGKHMIDEENVYANRFDYFTIPEEDTCFEAHKKYIDIHLLLSGREKIAVSDPLTLKKIEDNAKEDYTLYQGENEAVFFMDEKRVLVVFPEDAHRVKMIHEVSCLVEKVVIKLKY